MPHVQDIKVAQQENGFFDFEISDGDFSGVDDFTSAIYASLFSDARASETDVAEPYLRRGWIGDTASPVDGRNLGGLLWLVEQRRLTQSTLNETVDYARQSLNWFLEDGIATNVEVSGEISSLGIALSISITSQSGITQNEYVPLWRNTIDAN